MFTKELSVATAIELAALYSEALTFPSCSARVLQASVNCAAIHRLQIFVREMT